MYSRSESINPRTDFILYRSCVVINIHYHKRIHSDVRN